MRDGSRCQVIKEIAIGAEVRYNVLLEYYADVEGELQRFGLLNQTAAAPIAN